MDVVTLESAFPRLNKEEMELVREAGRREVFEDGEVVFAVGEADIDFFVVERGAIEVVNPTDAGRHITMHGPGEFSGDIDLLTRRAIIVTGIARTVLGQKLEVVRVPGRELRRLLGTVPRLGEKLVTAFTMRRELLEGAGVLGLRVAGRAGSAETALVCEFLEKNWVPYTYYDPQTDAGRRVWETLRGGEATGRGEGGVLVEVGGGRVLVSPTLHELAECAGVVRPCPDRTYDLAIVGAGPAGMAAAVYAASEGLATVVLDRLGPGGQAGGSSRIENFIGFPSGLSGNELAARGLIQMLKFGVLLLSPVRVTGIEPSEEFHTLLTDDAETRVRARVVLVATGARWRRLPAKGAERFERKGIYYSATAVEQRVCTGRPVVVVGAGNSGAQAAMFLSECSPRVFYVVRGSEFGPGMSAYLVERIRANEKIEVIVGAEVREVFGSAKEGVTAVEIGAEERSRRLEVSAVFVFIGAEPHSEFLPDAVARDEKGYVLTGAEAASSGKWPLTGRGPVALETTVPRLLAVGDVRCGSTKRVGFAVGDGSLAVTSVHRLLRED